MIINDSLSMAPVSKLTAPQMLLSLGQILTAQVVKAEDGMVWLQWGNKLLKAQSEELMKPGQKLQLRVEKASPQLIELKIIPADRASISDNNLLVRLQAGPESGKIVEALIKFNLPVCQAAISDIFTLAKKNKFTADLTEIIIWLKSLGIEVESDQDIHCLHVLQRFLAGDLTENEGAVFSRFINASENMVCGGPNIFSWTIHNHKIFLLTGGSKHDPLQPDNCHLLIKIDSRELGELWFKLGIKEDNLQVNIMCGNENSGTMIRKETHQLQEQLQSCGYRISKIPVNVSAQKPTILDLIPSPAPDITPINLEV